MTADEELHELLHGPMSKTDRDKFVRKRTAEQKEQQKNAVPTKAAGGLKVGDPILVHGLQSATGQRMNGRSGMIVRYIEETGRFQVQLGSGESAALKRDNLKYNPKVPEW